MWFVDLIAFCVLLCCQLIVRGKELVGPNKIAAILSLCIYLFIVISCATVAIAPVPTEKEQMDAESYAELGDSLRKEGEYEKAVIEFNKAIKIDPAYEWAFAHRGEAFRLNKEYEKAVADFDKAIELDPDYAWAFASRGESHRLLKNFDQALADFNKAVELDPYYWAYAHRGETWRQSSEYEKAISDFTLAIEDKEDYSYAYSRRGECYRMIENYERAVADLSRAIELDTENDYAYASRGETYRKMGDFLKALVDFNKALELDSDYTWVIEKRDELYKEMESKTKATPKSTEKSRSELPLLSVMDFVIENVSESEGRLIVDLLSSALIKIKKYRILDRSQRDTLIKELEFSYSDCTDETCQLELGRLLAADKIVVGSLGRIGKRYILNAKLLNVVTGEAVSSAYEIFKSIEELVDGSEAVARELIGD